MIDKRFFSSDFGFWMLKDFIFTYKTGYCRFMTGHLKKMHESPWKNQEVQNRENIGLSRLNRSFWIYVRLL